MKHTNLIFFKEQTNLNLISIKTNFPIIQLLNIKKVKNKLQYFFLGKKITIFYSLIIKLMSTKNTI